MSAWFGPAGNSESFSKQHKSSLQAPAWIAAQGLDCYEYQCGKGVHVGEETARKLGVKAREAGISLSLHAPYFINLANPDPEAVQKTIGYVLDAWTPKRPPRSRPCATTGRETPTLTSPRP